MVCQAYRGALGRVGWSPTVATLTSGVTSAALRPGKCAELGSWLNNIKVFKNRTQMCDCMGVETLTRDLDRLESKKSALY